MNNQIKAKLKDLPDLPGVYIMRDKNDEIIYVGKAINLKKRVRQYFDNNANKGRKVLAMVSHVKIFEYIIVENEVEALVLESNLIKKNRPKYNIVLRDDKQYPYIKITNEKYPRIEKVRNVKRDKGHYYGPYPDAYAVNDVIELFHILFPFRTCNINFDKGQQLDRPCLNYYIKRCNGPCIGKEKEKSYMENIKTIREFLENKSNEIPKLVIDKMNYASKNLDFENAAKYRDYHRALSTISQKQKVTNTNQEDIDIIAMSKGLFYVTMQVFFMRDGKIVDREHFILKDDYREKEEDIMASFMKQFYLNLMYIPKEILVAILPSDLGALTSFIEKKKGSKVSIIQPKLGRKKDLIKMAERNASDMMKKYEKRLEEKERKKHRGLNGLKQVLNLKSIKRIEAYDISNTAGVQTVGSMVVFEDGLPERKEYRKFKIKTVEGPDDYASLEEVLTRRFKRGEKEIKENNTSTGFGKLPDLILMDGGKGQVKIAKTVLKKFNLNIEVAGLVKDNKHTTRAIIYENQEISIKRRDPVYKLIYEIQEEAHRFAINYHRKLMTNAMKKSELDNIKGIGKKKKENLFNHFKTINNIKNANLEELMEVDLISKNQALDIIKYFKLNS
ncbi:excinuclease ABC subunit UvrC [Anaerococcus sp. AGMB00486]|uniref:UvrABC system protein C n=2 Tax=Anaerococcus TaxID=165779 RepID=A0ABX2N7C5_9FIRM|nr:MULTISPECIES: excinuclease ABC subunit UvrC [Anaerococcus]MSS77028.1 excinuclease ABC subunit UvrC [Anaerococcus porci]NVF10484.1 excinuclease ABC subunit UvrC [Anaerococcus faecalis]